MKISTTETFFLALAIGLLSFGYWGLYTKSGNRYFDEMAGIIPFFMLITGGIILLICIGWKVYFWFSNQD